uniref:Uncharacterized protein n=1 Tax=Cacopsylla melanoneura TaxID=428564 RepID=A0A8D8RGZ4_9HEMI
MTMCSKIGMCGNYNFHYFIFTLNGFGRGNTTSASDVSVRNVRLRHRVAMTFGRSFMVNYIQKFYLVKPKRMHSCPFILHGGPLIVLQATFLKGRTSKGRM